MTDHPIADGGELTDNDPCKEELLDAFVAGFTIGRTGTPRGRLKDITRRVAVHKFEQYYQQRYQSSANG